MKVEDACTFVRYGTAAVEGGLVHLKCIVFLQKERTANGPTRGRLASRDVGDFLCSGVRGRGAKKLKEASRDEFIMEPCHKCVLQADVFDIDVGSMWQHIPGPRLKLYTTSPEHRDRPYAKRSARPVGYYNGKEVFLLEVPEDMFEISRRWYQRDLYHGWTPETWQTLLDCGRAEKAT